MLLRDQRTATVGTSDGQVLGPNGKRKALIVAPPPPFDTAVISDNTLVAAANTATTGVKASYTVPAGVQAELESATAFSDAVAGVVSALQLVRGATTYNLFQATTNGTFSGAVPLQAGDVVQWNVTTAQAASTTDYTISVRRERVPARVTLSFVGAAVLDQGLTIFAGGPILRLVDEDVGRAFRGEVHAIASVGSMQIGLVDIFES